MSFRLLSLAAAALALALLALLVNFGDTQPDSVDAVQKEEQATPVEEETAPVVLNKPELREQVTAEQAGQTHVKPEEMGVGKKDKKEKPVLARIHVTMKDGSERSFEGHKIVAQTWIEETDEVFHHETTVNSKGVGEFVFPGFVHIDWVKYEPTQDSGLSIAVLEDHIDLDPGSIYEETLETGPGAGLHGRVVQMDGTPVGGASVHAYFDGNLWSDVGDWDPGAANTVTNADGSFQFPHLSAGEWGIAVEPQGWLQMDPSIEDPEEGRAYFDLAVGDYKDAGTFRVESLHNFKLTVLDRNGIPVPSIRTRLTPKLFQSRHLTATRSPSRSSGSLDAFLTGGNANASANSGLTSWNYGTIYKTTNENGQVDCFGIAGEWELLIYPSMSNRRDPAEAFKTVLQIPCGDRTITLGHGFWRLEGKVVNLAGTPIPRARVRLTRKTSNRSQTSSKTTSSDGTFVFTSLPPTGEFSLKTEHEQYLTNTHEILSSQMEPITLQMRASSSLHIVARDTEGNPLKSQRFSILSGYGTPSNDQALMPGEANWLENVLKSNRLRRTNKEGRYSFKRLLPGEYEVALMMSFSKGTYDSRGYPQTEYRPYQTWHLAPRSEAHELTVDMSGYTPPPPPRFAVHTGKVLDGATGLPVASATVRAYAPSRTRSSRTKSDGSFKISTSPGKTRFVITKDGYVVSEIDNVEYTHGEFQHEFLLMPGGNEIILQIRDKDGLEIPRARVELLNQNNESLLVRFMEEDGDTYWNTRGYTENSALRLSNVPIGQVNLKFRFWSYYLGRAKFEVVDNNSHQTVTVYLDMSLEEIRKAITKQNKERKNQRNDNEISFELQHSLESLGYFR